MTIPAMRYEPPKAKRSIHLARLGDVDTSDVSDEMRLFLAFQVVCQYLDVLLGQAIPTEDGRQVVAISPEAFKRMRALLDECRTGRLL